MGNKGSSSSSSSSAAPPAEAMAAYDAILGFARDNDAEGIRTLVAAGAPPSFGNKMGQTALHIAGIWGSVDAVKALLELKADPNRQNHMRGSAPLHACAMGRGPIDKRAICAKLLVAGKADPRLQDMTGETPIDACADEEIRLAMGGAPLHLHKAVQSRNAKDLGDCLTQLRAGRLEVTLDSMNQAGDTALNLAADTIWREGVDMLLAAGAAVGLPNYGGRTPLHSAALRGHHRIVQALLDQGASTNCKDIDPDHDPRFKSKSFEENPQQHRTPLHYAAGLGNIACMRLLLEQRSDVNDQDSQGQTPLHLCLQLREDNTQLDWGNGAQICGLEKRPEWNGRFASIIGPKVSKGEEHRFPVLLEGDTGDGVLLKSTNLQAIPDSVLDLLLEARADVNLGNQVMGPTQTVLHEAARRGDVVLAERCIAVGADVNRQDAKLGLSALHLAARGKHHEVAKVLVKHGADVKLQSGSGKTAYELAKANRCPDTALPIYNGEESTPTAAPDRPQTLSDLTAEQRAMLFID